MNPHNTTPSVDHDEVLITRLFDAPRELVFQSWTDPNQLPRWFAPSGCEISFARLDIRPGGGFHSCITTPDGKECWCVGEYREVVAPKRLVFSMAVSDREGRLVAPTDVGMDPQWPRETVVTVTFAEASGQTRLTLHQTVSEALAKRTGAYPSWLNMFERLTDLMAAGRPTAAGWTSVTAFL